MSESEWLACDEPDLLLEHLEGKIRPQQLVEFARRCWERIEVHLPDVPRDYTVVEQFAERAASMSAHDAALYASEAALKAAGWAPDLRAEQHHQAALLRQIVGNPFQAESRGR